MKKHSLDAFTIYKIISGADYLIFSMFATVVYVYLATFVTTDPFKLMLFSTVLTTTVLVFEIPTGVVADVYGRRSSVIIGWSIVGIGTIIEGVFQIFEVVLLAQVVIGLGFTFISGALEAWIADEIGEELSGQAYMRGSQVGQITSIIGIPLGTALGTIALKLPIILTGILSILLAIFLLWFMPEEGFQPASQQARDSWRTMFRTFGDGVRLIKGRPVLIAILLISTVYGLSSTGFDNLWTVNILENLTFPAIGDFKPVIWFGILNGLATILGLAALETVRRKVDLTSQSAITLILMFLTGATAICMVVFGLAKSFWLAAAVYCLSLTFRTASDPTIKTWINQNTESNVRATVFSMDSQVNSLGKIIGGTAVGAIGSAFSLPIALVTTGLARVPVTILFARLVLQAKGKRAKADKKITDI